MPIKFLLTLPKIYLYSSKMLQNSLFALSKKTKEETEFLLDGINYENRPFYRYILSYDRRRY